MKKWSLLALYDRPLNRNLDACPLSRAVSQRGYRINHRSKYAHEACSHYTVVTPVVAAVVVVEGPLSHNTIHVRAK